MLAGAQTFHYVWSLWDRLFGTQVTRSLAAAGIACPSERPPAWNELLRVKWDDSVAPYRKQTFFSKLSLSQRHGEPVYYRLAPLTLPEDFARDPIPSAQEKSELVRRVTSRIEAGLEDLRNASPVARNAFLQSVAQWAMARLAFHPDIPHLSVVDIASTAGAVDACLALAEDDNEPFVLVGIDLSGIQKYIFAIHRSAAVGVARRLRARSFFLTAFLDSVLLELLTRLQLTTLQVLSRSGGQAQLLLPNTPSTWKVLDSIQSELDRYALDVFEGQLSVHVAAIAFGRSQLVNDYPQVLRTGSERLRQRKQRALDRVLMDDQGWKEEAFFTGDPSPVARCQSCQRFGRFAEVCSDCERDARLGAQLPRRDRVYLVAEPTDGGQKLFGRWYLWTDRPPVGAESVCLSFEVEPQPYAYGMMWWCERTRHVAVHPSGATLEFPAIAARSQGKARLAYVKADLDRLGLLFAFGIPPSDTVAHACQVRALSSEVESFTAGYVQRLLTREYPDTYAVFAGGDDIAIVAPWDQGIEIACKLRRHLRNLAGTGNDTVTMSAAVRIVHPDEPVTLVMEMVEEELELAKESRRDGRDRDQIALFGRVMSWDEVEQIAKDGSYLRQHLQQGRISSSMLHELQKLGLMYRSYKDETNVYGIRYHPLLHYQLKRWREELPTGASSAELIEWLTRLGASDSSSMRVLPETVQYVVLSHWEKENAL